VAPGRLPIASLPGAGLNRPLVGMHPPSLDLTRDLPPALQPQVVAQAGPFAVPLQFFNMTTFPRPPQSGVSTPSQDIHPFWAPDEASILFASNRSNVNGTAGSAFHIWRSSADGSLLTQLTGLAAPENNGDQEYPALNVNQNRIAYSHRNSPADSFQLIVLDLGSGQRLVLTGVGAGAGLSSQLRNAIHPTWSSGGNQIAFAAQEPGVNVFNIYLIEVSTGTVTKITNGTDANGIDSQDPAFSPDGQIIAFASTGETVAANGSFATNSADYDIWYAAPAPPVAGRGFVRITGPDTSQEREPAWSNTTSRTGDRSTAGRTLLAFASNRAGSYDIWWIFAQDLAGQPAPETASAGNNPAKLILTQDVNADGSPRSASDERYPTWSRFVNTSDIAYQSNSAGNSDLWQADLLDITAPAVLPVDPGRVDNLRVTAAGQPLGTRVTFPGNQVLIEARVQDLQSGIDSVWVQFKDPDSAFQGALDGEHKLFRARTTTINGTDNITVFDEIDCEGVSADPGGGNYRYSDFPQLAPGMTPGSRPDLPAPTYTARFDDTQAFTGSNNPPFDGRDADHPADWLQLYDDGPAPAGHEPAGSVASDGIFSNAWTTPSVGSDFLIDLIVYDKAFDPLGRVTSTGNWKLYDNVWGFSTFNFTGTHSVLAVMDYPLGQKFIAGRVGGGGGGGTIYTDRGTESFILDVDPGFLPKALPTDMNPISGVRSPLGQGSLQNDLYDLWRIQCRGPLDPSVLANYAPTIDKQPDPADPSTTRAVPVATRAVLWSCPFAGDLWVGRGSIVDTETQALLSNFSSAGGRMFISGRDIAWALTQNGQVPNNPFFQNVLKASFVRDSPTIAWTSNGTPPVFQLTAVSSTLPVILGGVNEFQTFNGAIPNNPPTPINLGGQRGADSYNPRGSEDEVLPIGGSTAGYTFDAENGPAGHIWWEDATTTARLVFLSIGLEQIGRFYENNNGIITWNYREKVTHAALCWMTDFTLTGHVTDTSLRPVSGALVTATLPGNALATRTALTSADGSFIIRGLQPPFNQSYDISAQAPGFVFQHASFAGQHGMKAASTDLRMSPAAPAAISGLITNKQGGSGIAGVTVTATLNASAGFSGQTLFAALTASDGSYRISAIPSGTYAVRVDPVPSGFSGPTPASTNVTVTSGQDQTGVNFTLTPSEGGGGGPPGGGNGNLTLPAGVNLVALPGDFSDVDVPTLLGLSADQVRLGAYVTPENRYAYFSAAPADRFRLGRGYFISLQSATQLTTSRPVPTQPVRVDVTPGWNAIGSVGTVPVPLTDVQVQNSSLQAPISFDQAITQGILRAGVYKLVSGSGYQQVSQLEPLTGVWVRALQSATLIIPPTPTAAVTSASERNTALQPRPLGPGDWRVSVVARTGGMADQVVLGVSSGASDKYNALFDMEHPPRFSNNGRYLTMAFPHGDWGPAAAGSYTVDVRGPSNGTQSWDFVVQTNVPLQEVTLSWPEIGSLGRGVDLVLVDVDRNQRVLLLGSSGYSFRTGPDGTTRRFQIVARRRGSF
jgi:Tol biopolymer transport system component